MLFDIASRKVGETEWLPLYGESEAITQDPQQGLWQTVKDVTGQHHEPEDIFAAKPVSDILPESGTILTIAHYEYKWVPFIPQVGSYN